MKSDNKPKDAEISLRLSDVLDEHLADELGTSDALIKGLLAAARHRLGMEVAFVSEFAAGRRIFRYVHAATDVEVVRVGDSHPLDETYCKRVVEGQLPELIRNARLIEEAAALEITDRLQIGAYVGVPIRLADGSVYGTFCTFARHEDPTLTQRDLAFVRVFADVTGALIEGSWHNIASNRESKVQLQSILDEDRLWMAVQPIVSLEQRRVLGFEALARVRDLPWRPDMLFAEAERVGLANEFGRVSVQKALAQLAVLPDDVFISINVSPEFVTTADLDGLFAGTPLQRVVLEVTEHAAVYDYRPVAALLKGLREKGLRLAVDDAGSGYASFRHILALKPDIIKLDMSLTRDIDKDDERKALTLALVEFAKYRGYELIAEGIETERELEALYSLGVASGQGYFFARPAPLQQIMTELNL